MLLTFLEIKNQTLIDHIFDMNSFCRVIINLFNNPILQEGPINGYTDDDGKNYQKIVKIRQFLHDNDYPLI